ncbi:MAG TPA: TonB-dependent receptor [Steroidobacteraceae bacterium]|nr:TonB-dependent receptor [Steroidobacteraceae bacterium]
MKPSSRLAAVCLLSGVAYATNSVAQLEEIVVTAQKRQESQQDVPIAIQTLTGESLEKFAVFDSEELSAVTPALQITQNGAGSVAYIRGVGNQDGSGGQEGAVGTYVDGVWFGSVTGNFLSLKKVERVEVLKGPQGTLFGRNTTGGVINIITKDPSPETAADASFTYGDYDYLGVDLYGTTEITDGLAADLTLSYSDQGEGYGKDLATGSDVGQKEDSIFARTKWKYTAEDFSITASYFIEDFDDDRSYVRNMPPGSISFNGERQPSDSHDVILDTVPYGKFRNQGAMLRFERSFEPLDLVSITAWKDDDMDSLADNDSAGIWEMDADIDYTNKTWSQEFQLLSNTPDAKFTWIAGLFLLDQKATGSYRLDGPSMQRIPFFGPGTEGAVNSYRFFGKIDTQSIAGFGEVAYKFTDATRLTLGARYTRDERDVTGGNQFWAPGPEGFSHMGGIDIGTFPTEKQSKTWEEPTWRVVLDHRFSDELMVYASYNRGFRSGNFNTVAPAAPPVDPEIMDAYEIGMKSDLLNNRLRVNASAYYYDVKDLQFQVLQGITLQSVNAAKAEIKGIDLDVLWQATNDLQLSLATAWLDGEYKNFPNAASNPPTGTGGNGATVAFDASGYDIVYSPKLVTTAAATYTLPTNSGEYSLNVQATYNDGFNWTVDERLQQDDYTLLSVSAGWRAPSDKWGIRLSGRNLLDEEYSIFTSAQGGNNGDFYAPADPRTLFVTLDVSF